MVGNLTTTAMTRSPIHAREEIAATLHMWTQIVGKVMMRSSRRTSLWASCAYFTSTVRALDA